MTLPRGWVLAVLPDLVGPNGLIADGDWVESKDQDAAGSIRLTQLADIGDGYFKDRSRRFLRPDQAQRLGCTLLKSNDVLIARMPDPLGRACVFPGVGQEAVTVVDVCIVRVDDDEILPRWLVHFINAPQFRMAVAAEQRGSTRKRISKKSLCELALPVPPFPQQVHIADEADTHLSRLDAAVASLESAERRLKAYRASVLKAAVEGRLVPTEAELAQKEGRSYEPADVLLKRLLGERRRRWEETELAKMKAAGKTPKDDRWKAKYVEPEPPDLGHLPSLPKGWSWTTVEQLGEVTGGLTKNAARDSGPRRYPYLRVANVYANRLDLSELKEVAVGDGELPRLLLQRGDLLVVEGNGSVDQIGRVALWDGSIDPVLHQNHLIKVRFSRTPLERWVLTWLLSPNGRAAIERVASSTSGLHTLSISKVQSLPVPLPPENEQARVLESVDQLLSIVDASTDALGAGLGRCSRLRQSVLRWAFDGTLVDQAPNDEPADVLLTRIRAERAAATSAQPKAKRSRKLKAAS